MKNEESRIQEACVDWFNLQYPEWYWNFGSVPNGGYRTKITAAILKREGLKAGFSDLLLLVARGGFHGLCIEMKTPKGRQQESQRRFETHVMKEGYLYRICRSVEEFKTVVDTYLKGGYVYEGSVKDSKNEGSMNERGKQI